MKDIIFDLYGTLIDIYTNESSKTFWKRCSRKFKKYKAYTPTKLKNKYLKICNEQSLKYEEINLLFVFKKIFEVEDDIAHKIAKDFRRISIKKIKLYNGCYQLLKELKDLGYNIYLLSNAQDCFTQYELKKYKINVFFNDIAISSNYHIKKPNIKFFKALLEKNNIKDAIMIGNDYVCDIIPALSLGLDTIYLETATSKKVENVAKIKGFNKKEILIKIKNSQTSQL